MCRRSYSRKDRGDTGDYAAFDITTQADSPLGTFSPTIGATAGPGNSCSYPISLTIQN